MSQFGNFDGHWAGSSNGALALLREAADMFAKPTGETPTPDRIVTTLLWWLAIRYQSPCDRRRPMRFFDGVVKPPPAHESYAMLAAGRAGRHAAEIIDTLNRVMSSAASEWALGDPEDPDTRDVLRALCRVLWSRRLIPRPPNTRPTALPE